MLGRNRVRDDDLLHTELIDLVPLGTAVTGRLLHHRVREALLDDIGKDPDVTVVIRSYNEAAKLEQLLQDVGEQAFHSSVEIIVVDSGSADGSPDVAKRYGAEVVHLPQSEFTYPKSLNLGVDAASHDCVFVTVAHARLSNRFSLHAGARHFAKQDNTAGAFGTCLPSHGASVFERLSAIGDPNLVLARAARPVVKAGMGVLGATGAMIAKPVWEELGGFDDRYQTGGEDTALANSMLQRGYRVVQEPALTVHHSHGLGFRDGVKQYRHQVEILKGPGKFDRQSLLQRRPDLRANTASQES